MHGRSRKPAPEGEPQLAPPDVAESNESNELNELEELLDVGVTPPLPRHDVTGQRPAEEGSEFGVVDAGLSVEPEELGRQFLSDATEQDNFESSLVPDPLAEQEVTPLDPVLSDETLGASFQGEGLPQSSALSGADEVTPEPETEDLDLLSNAELPGSLFDHPARRDEEELRSGEDEARAEEEEDLTHSPTVNTDEIAVFEQHDAPAESDPDARAQAMAEERAALRRVRDRSEPKADRSAWESNRRVGRGRPFHRGSGR